MKRLHVMMLAYNSIKTVEAALHLFHEQYGLHNAPANSLTLVDARYPIHDQGDHSILLMALAERYGWNYVRPAKNYGVAGNWNWVVRELGLSEGDVLFGLDPDARPQAPGYLEAVMD